MTTITEIRSKLTDSGHDPELLKSMSKKELQELLDQTKEMNTVIDNLVVEETEEIEKNPIVGDEDWTDYVLSLMTDKEKDNGNPRVDGLRRVTLKLFGPFNIDTNVVQTPTLDNGGRATVVTTIIFNNGLRYSGAADVYSGNTHRKFAPHAVAVAETRSEGRALRKALHLSRVLAAEETYNAEPDEPTGNEGLAPTSMLNSLKIMTDKVNVDLIKLATHMNFNIGAIEDLTHKQALEIANQLSKYHRKELETPEEVKI